MTYKVTSLKERCDQNILNQHFQINSEAWPEFILNNNPVNLNKLRQSMPPNQLIQLIKYLKGYNLTILKEEDLIAVIKTLPLHFDKDIKELPDEGLDWGVKKSIADYQAGIKPNMLMGVQAIIAKKYQGKGLSSMLIQEMSNLAMRRKIDKLVIPLRPTNKHNYPLVPMEDYIEWKNDDELPFDDWIRTNIKAGGELIKVCSKSMSITGTIEEWKRWTQLNFCSSGSYIVPSALNPILIDLEQKEGKYIEPNIWILHRIEQSKSSM